MNKLTGLPAVPGATIATKQNPAPGPAKRTLLTQLLRAKSPQGDPAKQLLKKGSAQAPKPRAGARGPLAQGLLAGQLLARKPRTRRGQAASSDSDEASAKKVGARDEAMSSDEGDCSDALTGELARRGAQAGDLSKKKGGGIDQLHELERKLKKAEGRWHRVL